MNDTQSPFLAALSSLMGDGGLTMDPDILARHTEDWSGISGGAPIAVARPKVPADVSALLTLCHRYGQPVAVQGGLTGLCGAAST
ncbi:MAG: FAD-binding oxidoreductase, partial [Pseudomonadota bacterium]